MWLLFLPFFPVRTKTLVVVSIEMFVLLLASLCLVVITYLLFFHIYLRTYPPHWSVLCSQVSRVRWPFPTPLASASNQLQGERTNEHHERQLGKFYPETWGKHKRWKSCRLTRSERNGIYEAGPGHHGKRTGRLRKHQPEILPMKTLSSVTVCPLGRRPAGGPVAFSCALGVVGGT